MNCRVGASQTCDNTVYFSEVIKQKGLENVTVDDLVAEITPQGRGYTIIYLLINNIHWL